MEELSASRDQVGLAFATTCCRASEAWISW